MQIITLTTDLGLKDGTAAMIKGAVFKIAPNTAVVDISHLIDPQNVFEAACILSSTAPTFPENTIHVIVVDPGVGTERRAIAAKIGNHFFVGPDNGVLTLLMESAEAEKLPIETVHLTNSDYWNSDISTVFHGRDIFAPVAAHLSLGVSISKFGQPIHDVRKLSFPKSIPTKNGRTGKVVYIDNYGNIITNFSFQEIGNESDITIKILKFTIQGLCTTFGDKSPGELIVLYSGVNMIMISLVNGNAAQKIGATIGDEIELLTGSSLGTPGNGTSH